MNASHPDATILSATRVLYPESGQVVECITGSVLVFAVQENGIRLPLGTLTQGLIAAGCPPTAAGHRLLLTGLPGTEIRMRQVSDVIRDVDHSHLNTWFTLLGNIALDGRWVDQVVAPDPSEPLRLTPGERVSVLSEETSATDHTIHGWLRVTAGTALWCDFDDVHVNDVDGDIAVTRGVWLAAGLRCRIGVGTRPTTPDAWQASLDLAGRLAVESAVALAKAETLDRASRLAGAEGRSLHQVQEGVDILTGAITGPRRRKVDQADSTSAALVAAFQIVRASGLSVDDQVQERVEAEVALGRDPMVAVAEACRARARSVDLASGWWHLDGPPMVAWFDTGSAVALTRHGGSWIISDPAAPDSKLHVNEEVAATLRHKATEFIPILAPAPQGLGQLMRLSVASARSDITVVGLTTIIVGVIAFMIPYVLGELAGSLGTLTNTALLWGLVALLLVVGSSALFQVVRGLAMLRIRVKMVTVASGAVWDRIMRLKPSWHDEYSLGERMTQAVAINTAQEAVPDLLVTVLLDSVYLIGSLAAVATTTMPLLFALTFLIVLQVGVSYWLVRVGAKLSAARIAASAASSGRLMEILGAVNRLRVSGAEGRAFRRWAQVQAHLTQADMTMRRISTVQLVLIAAWPIFGLVVIVLVSSASGASFGDFVTAQTAASLASGAIAAATLAGTSLVNASAIVDVLAPVLDAVPEGSGDGINPGILHGDLSVQDIVFRYEPGGAAVLDGVSFRIRPGEHVAIVGPSGCGKTTLMRVLLGLDKPESGVIAVDGKDLTSLDRPSVRRQIGCVLQSATLLPGEIRYNVAMGRRFTDSQIWKALDSAAVEKDIRAMALGLDTPVVEGGGTLSGGQRQRILIARALAGEPRLLILDEATSALDNTTQAAVVESIEKLRLTRIVVAHRLSTIRNADRIIVLAAGKVVQEGTFDELVAAPGHFRDLALRQMA